MKDEEKVLDRCLMSIKDLVDEIVIVDTGSTDRSVEIAKNYGARVFHHAWQNDFSLHRNQSIKYAKGDWLLIIDCDEEIITDLPLKRKRLKKRLRGVESKYNAAHIRMIDKDSAGATKCQWDVIKIAKKGKIRFEGTVHNQPIINGAVCFLGGLKMNHYGYDLGKEKMDAKAERSIPLLEKRIEDDPIDLEAMYYLSNYLLSLDKFEEAVEWGEKALELIRSTGDYGIYFSLFHSLGSAHLRLGNAEAAWDSFNTGLDIEPTDIDLNYDMAMIGRMSGNRQAMLYHCNQYLNAVHEMQPGPKFRLNIGEDKKENIARWAMTKKILITGHSRSGTEYTAKRMREAGLDIGHQIPGTDGVVSWLHITSGEASWLPAPVIAGRFDMTFHQTRHPLKVISSAMTETDEAFEYRFKHIGHPGCERSLKWAMWSWLGWNELIEKKADFQFRIEDFDNALPEILEAAGYKKELKALCDSSVEKNKNTRTHENYNWDDLSGIDPDLTEKIQQKAVAYGYRI